MIRAALIWLLLALPLAAQDLPAWQHTSINDFARVLQGDDIRVLDQALIRLFDETDIEGTVVTLDNRAAFGGQDGLEPFATRLFNHWGVGDAQRNDGFMVLVLVGDREVRIELGAGYRREADLIAQDIVNNLMLPEFRSDRLSAGIRKGTLAVIDEIARPTAAGDELRKVPGKSRLPEVIGLGMFGFIIFQIIRNRVKKAKRRRCPDCGGHGVIEERGPEPVGLDAQGNQIRQSYWRACPSCGWRGPVYFGSNRDSRRGNRRSSGGFGGGRSSGGGASGRW
ncbi:TPM domain-containing protein [Paracoccus fistulariae]|uniref:TPM domain-containing protein n=1 Tax=Paracoccus fistulariae TaxID=658446 RepID=A0ABY7SN56_9RHOB|nr:TPM domain-containing protein [Paracoccus fistulariae]MDB6179886.1 TPM domain-containing protein [Paracoccus fistulariae]WCR07988.1 TPM domain-containing protein [Paracoccus fistulariae]